MALSLRSHGGRGSTLRSDSAAQIQTPHSSPRRGGLVMKFYANDVTNLANRRLRPSFIDDTQFGSFLEALPDGAALLEVDGRIKLVNSKLELLLNLAGGDLVGSELAKHAK